MRRLFLHLDTDRHPSAFDRIVAHDAGAEAVLSYGAVGEADVAGLVHGAIFTRGPKDLMKAHKAALARLFEQNDLVMDAEEIHELAAAL